MAEGGDQPSAVSKGVSGGGCGCGCLGLLLAAAGGLLMLGVPLEFYDPTSAGWYLSMGVAVVVSGLALALVGTVVYVAGYLFVP